MVSWNLINEPRDESVARASQLKTSGSRGDFFIRSVEGAGNLGLTVLVEVNGNSRRLENFLVEQIGGGLYRLRKSNATFSSIDDLVTYYSTEQFPPIPVQLNTNEFDQFKLKSAMKSDSSFEEYGFPDAQLPTFAETTNYNSPGLQDLRNLSKMQSTSSFQQSPPPSSMDKTKIELLRKQAEVMSAKRLAAEHNVRMLMEHAAGAERLTPYQVKANHEHDTAKRMEVEMAQMKNQGLLAGWQAQMEQIDDLRSSGARPKSTVSDISTKGRVKDLDASVQKLYSEIGLMNENFAHQVKQVEEEEANIRSEEKRLLVLNGVVSMVKEMVYKSIDTAVNQGEILVMQRTMEEMTEKLEVQQLQHEQALKDKDFELQEQENLYEETMLEKQDHEERLTQIATAMSPLASLLGGVPTDPIYGMNGRQARGSGYGANYTPVATGQPAFNSPNKTYGVPVAPPRSTFSPPAAKRFGSQNFSPTYERIPGEDYNHNGGKSSGWNRPGPTLPPRRSITEDKPTTFSIVKFKKPTLLGDNSGASGGADSQCSFLGNCQCPSCR